MLAAETRGKVEPAPVKRSAKVAFPLAHWPPPAPIRDAQSDAREQYGYDAAWTVIRDIVEEAGEDGMRSVFRAASDGTTAYPGDGAPETSALPNDWRRFLDLTQELGGATTPRTCSRTWVLPNGAAPARGPRDGARRVRAARGGRRWLGGAAGGAPGARRLAVRRRRRPDAGGDRRRPPARRDRELATATGLSSPTSRQPTSPRAPRPSSPKPAALAANTQASLSAVVAAGAAAAAPATG